MKPSKYKNRKVTEGGETFDSKAEYTRYLALKGMQEAGMIRDLTRQVSYILAPKVLIQGRVKRAMCYRADFKYWDVLNLKWVIEDKKGALTDVYKLKRHLMKWVHNIDILET